jgi:hypothetical protein
MNERVLTNGIWVGPPLHTHEPLDWKNVSLPRDNNARNQA